MSEWNVTGKNKVPFPSAASSRGLKAIALYPVVAMFRARRPGSAAATTPGMVSTPRGETEWYMEEKLEGRQNVTFPFVKELVDEELTRKGGRESGTRRFTVTPHGIGMKAGSFEMTESFEGPVSGEHEVTVSVSKLPAELVFDASAIAERITTESRHKITISEFPHYPGNRIVGVSVWARWADTGEWEKFAQFELPGAMAAAEAELAEKNA